MGYGVKILRTNKNTYGYEERQLKSLNHKRSVTQFVQSELASHLPQILNNQEIDETYFVMAIQDLEVKLDENFTKPKDKTIAKTHLAKAIQQYNIKNNKLLPIPKPIIRHNPESTFKNSKWFRQSSCAVGIYNEWINELENRPSAKLFTKEELLTCVLYSAAVHGGILNEEVLEAIKSKLHESDIKLDSNNEYIWLDILFSSKKLSHNHYVGQKTMVLRRWYIDNITLGLLARFLNHDGTIEKNYAVWTLFKKYIPDIDGLKKLKSLLEASIAILEHNNNVSFSQAHLNFMIGRIDSSSLSKSAHDIFLKTKQLNQIRNLDTISLNMNVTRSIKREQAAIGEKVVSIQYDSLIKSVNDSFKSQDGRTKPTKKYCLEQLRTIKSKYSQLPINMILSWLLNVGVENKVPTIERYWRSIAKGWLIETAHIDLIEFDCDDWEELYRQIIDLQSSDKAKQFCADRLSQFHQYLMRKHDVPAIESAVLGEGIGDTTTFVRTMFIPERAFSLFLGALEKLDIGVQDIELLKVFYILAYRTGMRRGELIKLKINDIEESSERWIFVTNNKFGNNKTFSALRKIPLTVLLTPAEKVFFENYLAKRKLIAGNTNTLLFSAETTFDEPLKGSMLSNIASQILSVIMGTDIIFHHFRHTALTRLQIILEDINLALEHTAYNEEQITEIKFVLGGFQNGLPYRDAYWAIAAFAGHLSPQQTFHSYLHLNELLIANKLRYSNIMFSHNVLHHITGLSKNVITRRCKQNSLAAVFALNADIFKSIRKHISVVNFASSIDDEESIEEGFSKTLNVKPATPTPELCYRVLKLLEDGGTIEEAQITFNLEASLIEKWMHNAINLANLKTTKGKSRTISNRRKTTSAGVVLTPAEPRSNAEKTAATLMLKKARTLLVHPDKDISSENREAFFHQQREKLVWCIEYFMGSSNTSKQGITFKSLNKFKAFYDFIIQIVDINDIRLELHDIKDRSYFDEWSKLSKHKLVIVGELTGHKNIPFGKVVLSVRHPDENEQAMSIKANKYSSSSLRYLFHLLYVMLV